MGCCMLVCKRSLSRYKWLALLLVVITAAYMVCTAPDVSWATPSGDDMGDLMLACQYLRPMHLPGFPTIVFLGYGVTHLPGNPFHNVAVASTIAVVIGALLVFLITREFTRDKYTPYICLVTFASAPIIFGEAIATKGFEYSLSLVLCLLVFYLIKKDLRLWAAIAIAFAIGTHPIAIVFSLVLLLVYLRSPKYIGIALSGLLAYIYIPLSLRPPIGQTGFGILGSEVLPVVMSLHTSGIAVRGTEILWVVLSGTGLLLAPLGVLLFRLKSGKDIRKVDADTKILGTFTLLITFWCLTAGYGAHIQWMVFPIAFMVLLGSRELPKLKLSKPLVAVFIGIPLVVLGMNTSFYDLGRNVDPEPTTARGYLNQLEELPDGSVVITSLVHTWTLTNYYECGSNKNSIILVGHTGIQKWDWYAEDLRERGLNIPGICTNWNAWTGRGNYWAKYFKDANPDRPIYWVIRLEGETLEFKVVEADWYGYPSWTGPPLGVQNKTYN